jgi:protein-disulfide isomerase
LERGLSLTKAKILAGVNFVLAGFACALLAFSPINARSQSAPAQSQGSVPSYADVQAALTRMLGYDPNLSWQIVSIHPSQIPGLADALVVMKNQGASHIYISSDGKFAVVGELIPFGLDPFAPNRALLAAVSGPTLGAAQPAIRIVEFTDLECQPCVNAQATLEKVAADFPTVQITYVPFVLPAAQHPWALKAAEYADCVARLDTAGFWKFVDGVFAGQAEINPANANDKFAAILTSAGADPAKISACAFTPETSANIQKATDLAGTMDVFSVPTMFINGRRLSSLGNAPYEQVKAIVKFELEHAGK